MLRQAPHDVHTVTYARLLSGLQAHADSVYAPLDKVPIPYDVLYNRACQQANLLRFNAQAPDTSTVGHFRQSLYELHTSSYNTTRLPCQADVRAYARQSSDRDTALIGMLHYGFGYLDSTAVTDNLVYYDTNSPALLHDTPGRSRSPYLSREATVMAALLDTARFGVLRYRLDTRLCYTNLGRVLSSVSVDFADGNGSQTLLPNQTRTITYSSIGMKVLRYTIYFTDGSQRTTHSSLYVNSVGAYVKDGVFTKNIRPAEPSCFSQNITADITYFRNRRAGVGEVEYYYKYNANPPQLCPQAQQNVTKPVVLIDGFDHDDERKAGNIYADKLVYKDVSGVVEQNFARELRIQGYDVVILNFPTLIVSYINAGFFQVPVYYKGGSAFMEANAYVLVKLIQQLNTQLTAAGSSEQLVIVGPSMGGQIAKYALAYMETNNLVHNTRLYVSLDSPHNGANTPIGDQLFLKYFAKDIGITAAKDGLEQVDSPASRELSLQHVSQLQDNTAPFQADPERGRFLANLANVGTWPQQLRRVAVVNGSLTAQRQVKTFGSGPLSDGEQAFYLRGKAAGIGVASARVYFSIGYGNGFGRLLMEGHYPLGQGRNYDAVRWPSRLLWLRAAPGGWFGVNEEIAEKVRDRSGITLKTIYSLQKNACFISMHSALGYQPTGGGPDDYCQPLAATNLVCDGTIPFDAYYGPRGANEEHIQLTAGNVNFLRGEITRVTERPSFLLAPTDLCTNNAASATFSVQAPCTLAGRPQPAITYTWTVDPGATFANRTTTSTGAVQTVHGDANFEGEVYVSVVATRLGYMPSIPKVWPLLIAFAELSSDYLPPNGGTYNFQACRNESLQFIVGGTAFNRSSIRWFAGSPGQEVQLVNTPQNTYDGRELVWMRMNGPLGTNWTQFSVYPMAIDLCDGVFKRAILRGTPTPANGSVPPPITITIVNPPFCNVNRSAPAPGQAQTEALTSFPNPANGFLTVQLASNPADAGFTTVEARLYNGQGQVVSQLRGPAGGSLNLPTAALPSGLYHVVVRTGNGKILRQHVEIKH